VVPINTAKLEATAAGPPHAPPPPQDGYVGGGLGLGHYNTAGSFQPQQGSWRYKMCDWKCDVCCSGLWWLACCCPALVMGQMLSRMGLDFCGTPAATIQQARDAFSIVLICFLVSLLGNGLLPGLSLAFFIYAIIFGSKLRAHVRSRYRIAGSCCDNSCDDCCCVLCCGCCTSIQMIQHTQPDNQSYDCCTFNGLRPGAPTIV
jgi:hypothetical protein